MTRGFAMAFAMALGRAKARQDRLRQAARQRGPASGSSVYAALDLGTNNCRLLIACPTGDGFRVVNSFSRIIRLGEGISATGCISEAAIERAIARARAFAATRSSPRRPNACG